ncbi:MAG TPA: hypothetical protein VK986_04370 [Tepidisphaeraceae bacterium]|nr:hypothetical protein [Tepidisphaeraceae bacterium]
MRSSPTLGNHVTTVGIKTAGLVALATLFLAGGVVGCAPTAKEEKFESIVRVSTNGAKLYYQAKQQYGITRALDLSGPLQAQAMNGVITLLDGAVVNDPKSPLFVGKRGEVFVELGPDGYARAEADLREAMKLSEDWAPAWIALAELETRRKNFDRARSYLKGAEGALQVLAEKEKKKPSKPFKIMGLSIAPDKPEEKDPRDPSLEENERRQLILNWLQDGEQWVLDSPQLLMPTASGGRTVNGQNLIRRLRARLEFGWVILRLAQGEPPASVLPLFDGIFEWDPDYFPARIEKAVQLRKSGQFREAERLLRPYVDSTDPKLANNARLLYELAGVYTDWYVKEGDPAHPNAKAAEDLARQGEQIFVKLHKLNPKHAAGWVARARMYAAAGERGKKPATLADAEQWLANARELLGADTAEMQQVQREIDRAKKALAAPAPAPAGGAAPAVKPATNTGGTK